MRVVADQLAAATDKSRRTDALRRANAALAEANAQLERQAALEEFKSGRVAVLVATDVASRGLDIESLPQVINFDIPKCVHTYLHRIGRSGRWGRKGTAINFMTRQDVPLIKNIESHYNSSIVELPDNFA